MDKGKIRLGRFDKWGYKNSFSKGELARELVYTNEDYDNLQQKYDKALELLSKNDMPCDIDNFNIKDENIDYCYMNCGVDDEVFKQCWNRYIEQELDREVK